MKEVGESKRKEKGLSIKAPLGGNHAIPRPLALLGALYTASSMSSISV